MGDAVQRSIQITADPLLELSAGPDSVLVFQQDCAGQRSCLSLSIVRISPPLESGHDY
jgi:hypothetical protein